MLEFWKSNNPLTPELPLSIYHAASTYEDEPIIRLKKELANTFDVSPAHVMLDNGSCAVIEKILSKDYPAVYIPQLDFFMFEQIAKAYHQNIHKFDNFQSLFNTLSSAAESSLVLFSIINNYDGLIISVDDIIELAQSYPQLNFVIDGAYVEYSSVSYAQLKDLMYVPNISYMGTFSKGYGLAGFRVGYLLSQKLKNFYPIEVRYKISNASAQAALYVLRHPEFLDKTKSHLFKEKQKLSEAGFRTSNTHRFFYTKRVEAFKDYLLQQDIECAEIIENGQKILSFAVQSSDNNTLLCHHLAEFKKLQNIV